MAFIKGVRIMNRYYNSLDPYDFEFSLPIRNFMQNCSYDNTVSLDLFNQIAFNAGSTNSSKNYLLLEMIQRVKPTQNSSIRYTEFQ